MKLNFVVISDEIAFSAVNHIVCLDGSFYKRNGEYKRYEALNKSLAQASQNEVFFALQIEGLKGKHRILQTGINKLLQDKRIKAWRSFDELKFNAHFDKVDNLVHRKAQVHEEIMYLKGLLHRTRMELTLYELALEIIPYLQEVQLQQAMNMEQKKGIQQVLF